MFFCILISAPISKDSLLFTFCSDSHCLQKGTKKAPCHLTIRAGDTLVIHLTGRFGTLETRLTASIATCHDVMFLSSSRKGKGLIQQTPRWVTRAMEPPKHFRELHNQYMAFLVNLRSGHATAEDMMLSSGWLFPGYWTGLLVCHISCDRHYPPCNNSA